jgi:hypothetical protein
MADYCSVYMRVSGGEGGGGVRGARPHYLKKKINREIGKNLKVTVNFMARALFPQILDLPVFRSHLCLSTPKLAACGQGQELFDPNYKNILEYFSTDRKYLPIHILLTRGDRGMGPTGNRTHDL